MRTENNKGHEDRFFSGELNGDMRRLLDGLIAQRNDLGQLGRELEYLLRVAGVTASIDPVIPNHYH
jgi:hypothetical protein